MPEILFTDERIVFSCNFLLGNIKVFALLVVGEATLVFQCSFCLYNPLQGFFIFLFYTARNRGVRNTLSRKKTKSTQRYKLPRKKIRKPSRNKPEIILLNINKLEDLPNSNKLDNYYFINIGKRILNLKLILWYVK